MSTAKDRVKTELEELEAKTDKLGNLIGKVKSDNWEAHAKLLNSMSNEQKKLLKKQYKIMKEYVHVLKRRLALWIDE